MKYIKTKKTILWCCIAILLFWQYPAVSLMAKNTSDSPKTAEVETFVKELYEAVSNRDINGIRERLEDDVVENWATSLVPLYSDDVGFGFRRYEDVEVNAYAVLDGDYFAAYVAYDIVIEWNGDELAIPGLKTLLVRQSELSQWCITSIDGLSDEVPKKLREEMLQLNDSDEIDDLFDAVSREYDDTLVNTPGLSELITEVNFEADKLIGSNMASEAFQEKGAWDYFFGEEDGLLTTSLNGEKDDIYIVQKGDCLWRIAEQELGDGMYWVGLYEANRDVIGENPDLLWVGIELNLGCTNDAE